MTFTIFYRDKLGKRASIEIDAPNKSALWPELKSLGISPISITEGSVKTKSQKHIPISFIIILFAAFLIGVIVITNIFYDNNEKNTSQPIKPPKSTITKIPPNSSTPARAQTPAKPKDEKMHFGIPHSEWIKLSRAEKVAIGQAAYDAEAAKIDSTYLARKKAHDAEIAARPFKYTSENVIANVFALDYGDNVLMAEFHPTLQEDFLKSLNDPIVIKENDDEDTRRLKKDMIELKPKIKALLDQGHTLPEILDDYRKSIAKVYELEVNLRRELDDIKRKSTSVEEVKDFIEAANQMMLEAGAKSFTYNLSAGAIRKIMINAERAKQGENK